MTDGLAFLMLTHCAPARACSRAPSRTFRWKCRPLRRLPSFFLPPLQQHSAPPTNKVICACTTTDDDGRLRRRHRAAPRPRLYPLAVAVTAPLSAISLLPRALVSLFSPFFPSFSVPPRSSSSSSLSLSYIIGMVPPPPPPHIIITISLSAIERMRERMKPPRSAVFSSRPADQRLCMRAHFL